MGIISNAESSEVWASNQWSLDLNQLVKYSHEGNKQEHVQSIKIYYQRSCLWNKIQLGIL